jgi:subtilisin family serine protease
MAIPLKLHPDQPWPNPQVDPYIRLAVALIETEPEKDGALLGLAREELDLLVELKEKGDEPLGLDVPMAYRGQRFVTGTVPLTADDSGLRKCIADLRDQVARLKLAVRQQPRLERSLDDMGLDVAPSSRAADNLEFDGSGVVIGIIDDGCAFAHHNFVKILEIKGGNVFKLESRVLHLWDQTPEAELSEEWRQPQEFGYGRALTKKAIDDVLAAHVDPATGYIREDAVYKKLGYAIEAGSHGTHVMDIAAGNGNAGGSRGVAPGADIVFVQIPKTAIGNPADSVLTSYLLDGIKYIFSKAGEKPAVINISYGGYGGPHDGTSLLECAIDEILANERNRAVVISAGNSFDVDCHAAGHIDPQQHSKKLRWIVREDDPTLNMMEIWYGGKDKLTLKLTQPDEATPLEIKLGDALSIRQEDKIVGWVFHRESDSRKNKDNHILIALRPSRSDARGEKVAPAPSGTWMVQLYNEGPKRVKFHAWIERDDAGSRKAGKKLQSRFAPEDASRECTLGSFATGQHTITVGGYNTATQEVCAYSACGPTRDGRTKPDVCAPAEEDAAGDGVLSATSLSSQPTRMNGTSVAAPHVAGLVALVLQGAHRKGMKLMADQIRELIIAGARASKSEPLEPNSRSPASSNFLEDRVGAGKVAARATLDRVR